MELKPFARNKQGNEVRSLNRTFYGIETLMP